MSGRAGVVVIAPYPVPDARDQSSSNKDDGRVVNGGDFDGDRGREAEQGQDQQRPGYES